MLPWIKFVALAGALLAVPAVHAGSTPIDQCTAHSAASLDALVGGDYAGARKDFSTTVAQAVDTARLEQVWKQIQMGAGAYQKHAEPQRQTVDGHALVVTPLTFANTPLDFVVGCDNDGRITTFKFTPATKSATAQGRMAGSMAPPVAAHVEASGVQVQPFAVTSPLGPLQGVLTLPAGTGPFPAVVLVAGSGPNDRDETIGPNKPFRDLADGLAAAGIASLRYDKRTYTYGAQMVGTAVTVDDEVTDDALSALHLLGQQPGIDPHRLFVLGHSLGALMVPRIARRYPQLAGAIVLAAPVTLDLDSVLRQIRYLGPLQGASPAQLDKLLAPIIAARNSLAHADPAHPPPGEFFHAPASYWLSLRNYDAIATARQLHLPMLVLQGAGDYQVPPQDDFVRWQAAFAHDPRVKLIEYPGLNHLFMPAGNPPSPADYRKPGHVDAAVVRDIGTWIKAQPPHA